MIESIGVLGGGAWGTALALTAARAGRRTRIWARNISTVGAIRERRENPKHLPGVIFDTPFAASSHFAEVVGADALLLAVPAQALRAVVGVLARLAVPGTPVVVCAKGLEKNTGKRMTEIVREIAPKTIPVVLSGPSFAVDVARGLPTAVTIASADYAVAHAVAVALQNPAFRPYVETDVIGVEIGGAVKNVLAIAAGIVVARKLGPSALAALTARAFAEMARLAVALGGKPETLMGLSGLGDLMLTCSSPQSRNFAYGMALGEGRAGPHPLVEGIETAAVARDLALRHRVEMPIVEEVAAIIAGKLTVDAAIDALMARPLKREGG